VVDENGLVTALRAGTATIRAMSLSNANIIGTSTITVSSYPRRTVSVDYYAEQIWRDHYGNGWLNEAARIFASVRIPFLHGWNIDLDTSLPQTITMRGASCPNATAITQMCSFSIGCGNNSNNSDCGTRHHKSGRWALDDSMAFSSRTLSVAIIGYPICYYFGNGRHDGIGGEGWTGSKGSVARGYSPTEQGHLDNARRITRNNILHELSHNFGCNDKPRHSCPDRCIMSGGFDDEPGFEDLFDIWCRNCKQDFVRTRVF
jgi:hypothetical protein